MLFHPRPAQRDSNPAMHVRDGVVPAADANINLGYRLYIHQTDAPLIVFFHGNGEVAANYDSISPLFADIGTSLLVFDYRGYGWSGGTPLGSKLLPDAESIAAALPDLIKGHNLAEDIPLGLMGRSLGGAPAIHLAYTFPNQFKGLILESTFAHLPSLLSVMGVPEMLANRLPDPFGIAQKMPQIHLPLLVIHGERDELISVENGQKNYDVSPVEDKTLVRIPGAGHNDILMIGMELYFEAIKQFIDRTR
jgi:hypothetical protein